MHICCAPSAYIPIGSASAWGTLYLANVQATEFCCWVNVTLPQDSSAVVFMGDTPEEVLKTLFGILLL